MPIELCANIFMNPYRHLVWAGTVFLIIAAVFTLVSINHKLNTAATTNTVSFSGQGKIVAKPDVAVAYLEIVTQANTSKSAQDENSRRSKVVVDFLKKQGVGEDDIKTNSYNIYPQYVYPPYGGRPSISGYQVTQSLEVKIRDLDKVSGILDGVVSAGVNQINNLSFQVDDPEKQREKAREEAIKDAKEKADRLEDSLGVRLGKIVNFAEDYMGGPTPPIYYAKDMAGGFGGGGGGPEIPTGTNEILVNVSITYQIK